MTEWNKTGIPFGRMGTEKDGLFFCFTAYTGHIDGDDVDISVCPDGIKVHHIDSGRLFILRASEVLEMAGIAGITGKVAAVCQSCDWQGDPDDVAKDGYIHHIYERVAPGEIMPAGECPECNSLCTVSGISQKPKSKKKRRKK